MSTIALLTDFGDTDWFVASMKAVIAGINPTASIIDITHRVPRGDIRSAAIVLKSCFAYFPEETVFVIVVDPGVGSSRKAIAARDHSRFFVAPDNGVVSMVISENSWVHSIENEALFVHPVSSTFHGRDIFAPVGAHLANSKPLSIVGPKRCGFEKLSPPLLQVDGETIRAEIIYIDHFGNAFTSVRASHLRNADITGVLLPDGSSVPVHTHYAAVEPNMSLALINSEGYLEIAVNGGSAAEKLRLTIGSTVTLQ